MSKAAEPSALVKEAVQHLERVVQLLTRLKDSTSDGSAQGMLDALLEQLEEGRQQLEAYREELG
jgi:phage tail tape-measure protein